MARLFPLHERKIFSAHITIATYYPTMSTSLFDYPVSAMSDNLSSLSLGAASNNSSGQTTTIALHSQKDVSYTVRDVRWIPSSASFLSAGTSADGKGVLEVYELTKTDRGQRDIRRLAKIERPAGVRSLTFSANTFVSRRVGVGEANGRLSVIDFERLDAVGGCDKDVFKTMAHPGSINCIDGIGGSSGVCELVSAGDDGVVRVWDLRQPAKAVMVFRPANARIDCWTVGFGGAETSQDRFVCSGYENGDLKLFDMRNAGSRGLMWEKSLRNGICSLDFDRKTSGLNRLAIGCLQSQLSLVDFNEKKDDGYCCRDKKIDGSATLWCVRHLAQNRRVFSTCSGSGTLAIWRYDREQTIELVKSELLSSQPLISVDWNEDMCGLGCVGALDQSVRVVVATKLKAI